MRRVVHELEVHQVELQAQNEELRRAQAELTAERARYLDLYDLAPVGYCSVTEKGLIMEANLTAEGLLGAAQGALLKQLLTRFILKEDWHLYYLYSRQIFGHGSTDSPCPPAALKLRMVRKDGTIFWACLNATAAHTEHGVGVCRLGLSDITALMTAEQARQQSGEHYTRLYEGMLDAFVRVDMNGRIQEFNPAYQQMLGYSAEELRALTYPQITPERWYAFEDRIIREQVLTRGHSDVYEKEYRRKDGTVFPVELRTLLVRNESGRPASLWAIVRDISARKQAEVALRASEERFRALAESALVGIYVLQDGKYAYVNPAMGGVFGYSAAEMIGKSPREIVQPCDHDMVGENIRRRITGEVRTIQYEVRGRHKDGSTRDVECYGTTVELDGKPALVGTLLDITERKRAENLLRESEVRFRVTFEQAAVGIVHVSPEGRFLRINRRFCDIVRYTREEMLERTFQEITYPDDLAADLAQVQQLLSGQMDSCSREKRYVCKDGALVWVNLTTALVRNDAGQPLWFVSVVEDISDRKRVQGELEDRLSFERLLAEISARLVSVPGDSIDAEIRVALQRICEILGFDLSALWQFSPAHPSSFTMTHFYVLPDFPLEIPDDMDAEESFPWSREMILAKQRIILRRTEDAPAAAARDKETWKHYGVRSILTFPLFAGDGSSLGAQSFSKLKGELDCSEELIGGLQIVSQIFANALNRKFTEQALRDSEAQLKLAADSADMGLWSWDYESSKIWATEKAHSMYGLLPDEEITADTFFRLLHPDDVGRIYHIVDEAFRTGAVVQTEYRIVLPDKRIRWMSVRAQAFLKPSGEPDRLMGASLDISTRKESDQERIELRTELAHLSRVMAMSELSTSLAHEINQPLGAILNNASAAALLLPQTENTREEIGEALADIIQDAKRAGDVVRKIRGIVKRTDVQLEPLQINTLIEDVIALFQNSINMNNVSLHIDLGPDLAIVRGDRVRLQQVLLNLMTNAMEAMRGVSSKVLTIRSAMETSDTVTVSVSDSGTGVPAASMDRVFEPFFTTKRDGLGMGLRISQSIIEEHGGRIWGENNPDAGATFSFSLKA